MPAEILSLRITEGPAKTRNYAGVIDKKDAQYHGDTAIDPIETQKSRRFQKTPGASRHWKIRPLTRRFQKTPRATCCKAGRDATPQAAKSNNEQPVVVQKPYVPPLFARDPDWAPGSGSSSTIIKCHQEAAAEIDTLISCGHIDGAKMMYLFQVSLLSLGDCQISKSNRVTHDEEMKRITTRALGNISRALSSSMTQIADSRNTLKRRWDLDHNKSTGQHFTRIVEQHDSNCRLTKYPQATLGSRSRSPAAICYSDKAGLGCRT